MKFFVKFILPVLILSAAVAVFATLRATKPEQQPAEIKERVWRVEVWPVRPGRLAPSLILYGRVESPSVFKAAAPAPSRVEKVQVREGDRVRKGQELVSLDARDFLPGLEQARAKVAELEAQLSSEQSRYQSDLRSLKQEKRLLELSREGMQRASRLMDKQMGSDSALDEAEQSLARQALVLSSRELAIVDHPARLKAVKARLQSARARLTEVELEYERSRIKAPYDGIVSEVMVAEGDQVADNAVLLKMYDLKSLEVRARIPAPFQDELQQTRSAGQPLTATSSIGSQRIDLRLSRLAGEADSSGLDALFALEEVVEWLRPGQVLRLSMQRQPQDDVVAVPYPAVYDGHRVYKLVQGRMRGLRVEALGRFIGDDGDERLLVRSPELASGDALVITHLPNAIEGLRAEAVTAQ